MHAVAAQDEGRTMGMVCVPPLEAGPSGLGCARWSDKGSADASVSTTPGA